MPDAKFLLTGHPYRMACFTWKRAKDYHGWSDAGCERFDRDDRSVSLFKRAEVGLA